ncbi:hypothetical protein H6G52_05120 [Limnothrix sp. FACHB-881]|nr:hypothetical protein [Limnothrix sp. FACHB-881]MBD2634735.1 hypothetical protein [Limnothrix sp. FACHB-881]
MDSLIWAIGHGLAVVIGIALGPLGGGGSVLALPILTSVIGVPVKPAIAMTLAIHDVGHCGNREPVGSHSPRAGGAGALAGGGNFWAVHGDRGLWGR